MLKFNLKEREEARAIADQLGIRHVLLHIDECESPEFAANTGQRCYYCKKTRFGALSLWAKEQGYAWVLDGANADDCLDYRPDMKAIVELEGVCSPLLKAGLTKAEIREISREWGCLPGINPVPPACHPECPTVCQLPKSGWSRSSRRKR